MTSRHHFGHCIIKVDDENFDHHEWRFGDGGIDIPWIQLAAIWYAWK
jgi:hypothetical protein